MPAQTKRTSARRANNRPATRLGTLPEWNLADLYRGIDDPQVKRDLDRADAECVAFEEAYKGKLAALADGTAPGAALVAAVKRYEALDDLLGRLISYAGLVHAGNTVDPARATAPIPTPTPEPTPVPTPEPEDMNVVITLSKPVFAAGEAITGRVTGLSGDRDWVAVVPAGSEDGTAGKWVYAGGATEADFTLPGQEPGAYEIRVRFHDQYRPVRRRLAVEVK